MTLCKALKPQTLKPWYRIRVGPFKKPFISIRPHQCLVSTDTGHAGSPGPSCQVQGRGAEEWAPLRP